MKIQLKEVIKKYDGKAVLNGVNLSITEGEMIAITGPSGCGKSTLLNILGLILEPTSGSYTINGVTNPRIYSKVSRYLRREHIGYLFQNYGLIDDESVFWNLKLALNNNASKGKSKKEKEKLIDDLLDEFGLLTLKNSKIYQLSGGEQQRIALIRLMLHGSDLILADEPTGNLDQNNGRLIMEIFKKLKKEGKTIIIVTHDMNIANHCDRILKLENGKLLQ